MTRILGYLIFTVSTITACLLIGCGGAITVTTSETPEDAVQKNEAPAQALGPRSKLARAQLTTAVDERRYRAVAAEQDTFDENTAIIYLVGQLQDVPADASITVRWQREGDLYPLLTKKIRGSTKMQFIASLSPDQASFTPGVYYARIDVEEREIGAVRFTITGTEREPLPIVFKKLRVSKKVDKKMRPIGQKKTKFRKGTGQIYATFIIENAAAGSQVNLVWWRNGKEFHEEALDATGSRRKGALVSSDSGLPPGLYKVTVDADGTLLGTLEFQIGKPNSGPGFDDIVIGTEIGPNNIPLEARGLLSPETLKIYCGLSFVDLVAGSVIEVQWVAIKEDGETIGYTNRLTMPSAGTGSMGVSWSPHENLPVGPYKVRVLLDGENAGETRFFVGTQEEFDAHQEQLQTKAEKKTRKRGKPRAKR